MTRWVFKGPYIVFFVIVMLIGMQNFGYGDGSAPDPPPGVQDPNTLRLTGPAFLATIKIWENEDTTKVDILISGQCGNYKLDPSISATVALEEGQTFADLTKEYFQENGWDDIQVFADACGWSTSSGATNWILASPVAVPSYSTGNDGKEFIEVRVVYLGRLLTTTP